MCMPMMGSFVYVRLMKLARENAEECNKRRFVTCKNVIPVASTARMLQSR